MNNEITKPLSKRAQAKLDKLNAAAALAASTAVVTVHLDEPNPFEGAPLLDQDNVGECMGPEYASDEQIAAIETFIPSEPIDLELDTSADDELDEALAVIEASDVLEIVEDVVPVPQASEPMPSFASVLAAISEDDAIAKAIEIAAAVDERCAFEAASGNDNIQKALTKSRKQLATPRAARVMIACSIDPAIVNRSVHEGKRYNVYALGKLADAIYGLSGGAVNNAINVACMRSLFQFKAAGKDFTGEMAKAAASDKIRVDIGLKGLLVRHTVSASTASTQASSTMQALTTLGIVTRSGNQKNPTFTLSDTPVTAALQSLLFPTIAAAA